LLIFDLLEILAIESQFETNLFKTNYVKCIKLFSAKINAKFNKPLEGETYTSDIWRS